MIETSSLIARMEAALDAEGSDRYTFDRDYKPAINHSIEYLVSIFNFAFGQKKLSEENLRELTRTRIFQTSKYSRVNFNSDDLGEEVWSILVVSPEPVLDPELTKITNPDPTKSLFVDPNDAVFVKSDYSANRQTSEEWNDSSDNVFMPGNTSLQNKFKNYAYRNFTHYKPGEDVNSIIEEIEIRPYLDEEFVAITYLVFPENIDADDDQIMFPKTMTNLLVDQALKFISLKQGDGTNLYSTMDRDVNTLVSLMS